MNALSVCQFTPMVAVSKTYRFPVTSTDTCSGPRRPVNGKSRCVFATLLDRQADQFHGNWIARWAPDRRRRGGPVLSR